MTDITADNAVFDQAPQTKAPTKRTALRKRLMGGLATAVVVCAAGGALWSHMAARSVSPDDAYVGA